MKVPEDKLPIETHCHLCGAELTTKKARKKRLGGIFSGRWQWEIDAVCSGCGRESSAAISLFTAYHPPGLIMRNLRLCQGIIRGILSIEGSHRRDVGLASTGEMEEIKRRASKHSEPDGSMDLARLMEAMPFQAYGMKGNPLGFRLTSFGYGRTGEELGNL